MFWSAYLWADVETYDTIQYKGDSGPGNADNNASPHIKKLLMIFEFRDLDHCS